MKRLVFFPVIFILILTLCLSLSLPVLAMPQGAVSGQIFNNQAAVDQSADGTTVYLRAGEELVVTLSSNSSTGYSWELVQISDESVLRYISDYYAPPASGGIGAVGTEVWTFQAVRAGTAHLSLQYSQSWSGNVANTFDLDINVAPPVPGISVLSAGLLSALFLVLIAFTTLRRRTSAA